MKLFWILGVSVNIMLLLSTCGSAKNTTDFSFQGDTYVSVLNYGANASPDFDNTRAIQTAFDQEENVYFPPGRYEIATATRGSAHNPYMLLISELQKTRRLYFAEGAELVVDGEINLPNTSIVILKIFADASDLERLSIHGLHIVGEGLDRDGNFTGLKAIEHRGNQIKSLLIDDAQFDDLSGAGIITYASWNKFTNIRSRNLGSHGIGARNPYNLDDPPHELYIDGYHSVGNRAYSIDFSGTQIGNDASTADPRDRWIGEARNIRSEGAMRGIKTAGHWDLLLEDVAVIDSEIYGFFINKDAPNCTIQMRNILIERSGNAAMSLSGKTHLEAENLRIIGCAEAVRVKNTSMKIKGLIFDGQGISKSGLRISANCEIDDFVVTGVVDDYTIWLIRGDVKLSNGSIHNNRCRYPVLVHENAGEVELDRLVFTGPEEYTNNQARTAAYPSVLSLQKGGSLVLRNMNQDVTRQ